MTARNDFHGIVADWLADEAQHGSPDYLGEILARTTRTRQRPAWSSLERWLPVSVAVRSHLAPIPPQLWFIALVAALALAVALVLLAGVGQRVPSLGAIGNGQIAFVDGGSIRFADADGTVRPLATTVAGGAWDLRFSPDGRFLVYRTGSAAAQSVVIVNTDGSHPVLIDAGDSQDYGITWSPDSRRIAFAVANGAVESIAVVDADGSHLRQLVVVGAGAGAPVDPTWSPDGNWIAFFSGADTTSAVSLIHPDGSGRTTLNTLAVARDGLAWSPDPARLRVTYKATDVPHSSSSRGPAIHQPTFIRVYDLAAARESEIVETTILSGTTPTWSPDGSRISWWDDGVRVISVADAIAGHASPLMVLPAGTGGCSEHPDLAGKAVCGPAQWSPDSRWLFGPGIGDTTIVFGRSDGSPSSHAIVLDQPLDFGSGQAAWQPVVPS